MANEKLKSVLGEDGMTELSALLAPQIPAWRAWTMGVLKSKTAWFGAALVALPDLITVLAPQLEQMLDANSYKRLMNIAGIVVILLRFVTSQSLKEKGAAA
jgi:hypothetical protein